MGRGEEPIKMEIDLSLNIDADEHMFKDEEVKEYGEEEMARKQDKEEVPEATAGEIEDDSSVVEISMQETTKTREVQTFISVKQIHPLSMY